MASCVYALATSDTQAVRIANRLRTSGFSAGDISIITPDRAGARDLGHQDSTKAPEGATAGGGTGAILGGALGWLAGIGALAIPGVGPLIAAGPILGALTGAAVGGTVGGLTGALVGMGIPEYEAKRYEGKVKGGNALISVHSENSAETDRAKTIFEAAGGQDISTSSEAAVGSHA